VAMMRHCFLSVQIFGVRQHSSVQLVRVRLAVFAQTLRLQHAPAKAEINSVRDFSDDVMDSSV